MYAANAPKAITLKDNIENRGPVVADFARDVKTTFQMGPAENVANRDLLLVFLLATYIDPILGRREGNY